MIKGQKNRQNALKERLSQNRWLLPMCWCSSNSI